MEHITIMRSTLSQIKNIQILCIHLVFYQFSEIRDLKNVWCLSSAASCLKGCQLNPGLVKNFYIKW